MIAGPVQTGAIALLALGLLVAAARRWRRGRDGRPAFALWMAMQTLAAGLLWLALFPPPVSRPSAPLTVLTAGAAEVPVPDPPGILLALPEAGDRPAAERVPDLATALRRHPGHAGVQVVGAGLPARDRDAARGRVLALFPALLPRGLVELDAPRAVAAGARWRLRGRVEGVAGGSVELRDPAGATVDRAALAGDGGFALAGLARVPGRALFELAVLDGDSTPVESVPVAIVAEAGPSLRVQILSGAPNPELKYLRRWALDAGLAPESRIALTRGARLGAGTVALTPAELAEVDLLILDERAFADLGPSEFAALTGALEQGLGVLVRLGDLPPPRLRAELAALGFEIQAADLPRGVRLIGEGDEAGGEPTLNRRPLRVASVDAVPLLTDAGGEPLALWRAHGRGRIGLWWLADSYRLVLAGAADRHGSLWAKAVGTLARARAAAPPRFSAGPYRVGERLVVCGLDGPAQVEDAGGKATALVLDPVRGRDGCAAFWPERPGWHLLRMAGEGHSFHVLAEGAAPALAAAASWRATEALAALSPAAPAVAAARVPGPAWPWFLTWLAVSALLWILERRNASR